MQKLLPKLIIALFLASLLSACSSKYNVQMNLTPEEIQASKVEISKLKEEIKNFQAVEGEIPIYAIVRLAKAYEKIGKMGAAIGYYKRWLEKGKKAKAIINNLGRLYEQVGEYELAEKQYQRLIDEYGDDDYLYDLTWTFLRAAQKARGGEAVKYRKKAEKYFNAWQLAKKKTDEQTQEEIKRLREKEKIN